MEFDEEHSTLAFKLVGEQVETLSLIVMDNFLDERDVVELIKIYPCSVIHVEVYSVLDRRYDGNRLVFAHQKVVGLPGQRHVEECKLRNSLILRLQDLLRGLEVESYDSVLPRKQQVGHWPVILGVFELELHGNLFEVRVVHDFYFLDVLKLVH